MIAAAGSGQRLGAGGPKAFVEVAGEPLLAWSLRALAAAQSVDAIVVAAPPGEEERCGAISAGYGGAVRVIAGGVTRAESVALGVAAVDSEVVAVHDAARPLVTSELIERVLGALAADHDAGGAIAARPVADTLKRAGDGLPPGIEETVPRAGFWAAETPQAFRTAVLRDAQARAREVAELAEATDEAMLVEGAGGRVLLVDAGAPNPKVTTAADLALVAALLAGRG